MSFQSLNVQSKLTAAITAVLVAGLGSAASAAVWQPTGGNHNWNVDANWDTTFPNGAGAVADLSTQDLAAAENISLQQAITVGNMSIGDTNGSAIYNFISGAGTNVLTFDSGTALPATLTVRNEGTLTSTFGAGVALNSNLNLVLTPSVTAGNRAAVSFNGGLNLGSNTLTIVGGYAGTGDGTQFTLGGANNLLGDGTIINNSESPMIIDGQKTSFTGTLVANGRGAGVDGNTGTITLNNGSVLNAKEIIVNGVYAGGATNNYLGGKLQIGTGSTIAAAANQRLTQNRITLNGGFFNNGAVGFNPLNYAGLQTNTVANLDFNSGFAVYNMTASANTAGNKLNVATVERGEGATAFIRLNSATAVGGGGQNYSANFFAGNGASLVVGSTATSGTATRVIPWMVASTSVSNAAITQFATYDAVEGFRLLRTGEFYNGTVATAAVGDNVSSGDASIFSGDKTVNALYYNGSGISNLDGVDLVDRTLTITSGGLIFSNQGAAGIGQPGDNNGRAGIINFGSAEGVITNVANNSGTVHSIGSSIAGSGGLTKGGFGVLELTGANTYTGDTHVSGGTLRIGNGTFNSNISDDDVTVHAGAVLDLNVAGAAFNTIIDVIDDGAELDLYTYGLFSGKTLVSAGLEEVGSLVLGGEVQESGYYGSTAAASLYAGLYDVTASDVYFGGNGLIFIEIPEPTSLGLLGLAGLGLIRRRKAC